MTDEMVKRAQQFVNSTYGTVIGMTVDEDGKTGWNTMYALTRALQHELGITALSNSFGPTTLSILTSKYPFLDAATVPSANFCRIIQSAMYCKGYDGGDIDGTYNSRVQLSMLQLKVDMGVASTSPGYDLTPKVFKGLLNMDAYVSVNSGSDAVRSVQQWLNGRYLNRADFFIIPCDGHNSRDVSKSMLFAIQYELGMADGVANGVFGPGTQSGLRSHTLSSGATGTWVSLFSAAMILNARPISFVSIYDGTLTSAVSSFQAFAKLPVSGNGDFQTWASLLISYGDQTRQGAACDGVTKITPARAAALKSQGIMYVGRYLTNPSYTSLPEKAIQPGELQTIASQGLRCFPIYQTFGRDANGFNYPAGNAAGLAAVNAAVDLGFKNGTRIFFSVDFDALDEDITEHVLPHFKGIEDALALSGNPYEIGVYGARNVCTRVAEAGHSTASFVSDMSSGFSGNFGYSLPSDWAYDQIVTRSVGSGDGAIEIDNNIASGRDLGQSSFNPPRAVIPDVAFDGGFLNALHDDIGMYMRSIGFADESVERIYSHTECFETVLAGDEVITLLSQMYNMRKALIQTSVYWEMRHYDYKDLAADAAVVYYHTGTGGSDISPKSDSSTGIGQISGDSGIRSWNYCYQQGYSTGTPLDPYSDDDVWTMWHKLNQDNTFTLETASQVHLWATAGKPGGKNPPAGETTMRTMRLDYTESEVFELLRRYQGWGQQAEEDNGKRMPIYQIFEKYNGIVRNL